ncbi:MAG: hypothetical protein ACYSW4_08435 [Planctomycetota bacterium]
MAKLKQKDGLKFGTKAADRAYKRLLKSERAIETRKGELKAREYVVTDRDSCPFSYYHYGYFLQGVRCVYPHREPLPEGHKCPGLRRQGCPLARWPVTVRAGRKG